MSLTLTDRSRSILRNRRFVVASVQFDNSYPTGGEAITASQFGLGEIEFMSFASNGANEVVWDRANSKLKVFVASSALEVANLTDLSALTVDALIVGT